MNYRVVTEDLLEEFYEALQREKRVTFDIETTGLYPFQGGDITLLGFGLQAINYVLPLEIKGSFNYGDKARQQAIVDEVARILGSKVVIAHNGKFDLLWMRVKYGVKLPLTHDTMQMSHLIDENCSHGLKNLAEELLDAPHWDLTKEEKKGHIALDKLCEYNAYDVYYTRKLFNMFIKEITSDPALYKFYKNVIMPAVNAFIDIEECGVYIDIEKMQEVKMYLQSEVARILGELEKYKKGMNWNSTKQLSDFLFNTLKLKPLEYTAKGACSTSESVLLRLDHPAVSLILQYREAYKMLSGFIEGWGEQLSGSRLHPSFKLHGTVTGRLSCTEPNLQQVPRNPKIRSLVCAPPGYTFVEADFSQVELRIAAMLSGDPTMREVFLTGQDPHTETAKLVSGQDPTGMDKVALKEWRKKAKAVNFGFLYGMGYKKFQEYARDKYGVKFTEKESKQIRDRFFSHYAGLQPWYARQERVARMNGYVRSPAGRVRHLPDINSPDHYLESQAIRQAINSPVQGFASDLTLTSVVDITRELPHVRIVGTVHDAILMEIPDKQLKTSVLKIKEIMENPPTLKQLGVRLTVPIVVDISIGPWGTGENYREIIK